MRRFFLILLVCSFFATVTAGESGATPVTANLTQGGEEAQLLQFVSELTRQYAYGFSQLPDATRYFPLSRRAAFLCTRPLWLHQTSPVYVYELPFDARHTAMLSHFFKPVSSPVAASASDSARTAPPAEFDAEGVLAALDNRDESAQEAAAGEEAVERYYVDKSDSLRRFSYGVEHFASSELDGVLYMTNSDGKTIVRRAYDSAMRLTQTEIFAVPGDVKNLIRSSLKTFRYTEDAVTPSEIEFTDEKNKQRTLTRYNERSLPVRLEHYHIETETKADASTSKEVLDKTVSTFYDAENRILHEDTELWSYPKDSKNRVTQKCTTRRCEYVWTGAGGSGKPDTRYYEQETLRIQTIYASPAVYTETLFFDGGFSVQTTYENRIRKLEVILLHGEEQRRRTFDY